VGARPIRRAPAVMARIIFIMQKFLHNSGNSSLKKLICRTVSVIFLTTNETQAAATQPETSTARVF
jgi:hypothetical protein